MGECPQELRSFPHEKYAVTDDRSRTRKICLPLGTVEDLVSFATMWRQIIISFFAMCCFGEGFVLPSAGALTAPRMSKETLIDSLTTDEMPSLARLAALLGHARLVDIESISVTRVDDDSLELCVITCEDDGCICLMLPIPL